METWGYPILAREVYSRLYEIRELSTAHLEQAGCLLCDTRVRENLDKITSLCEGGMEECKREA